MSSYYVYVYIDPRNLEEFYFGKGLGSRKNAHLYEETDSSKSRRIAEIRKEGLEPIVRVIARGLSEHDALLVEKTLLWKLGRTLTNVSSGHYSKKFRPHDTLHKEISGFDFEKGLYYYNVGEGPNRHWDDYRRLGFISAGQGARWRDSMLGFNPGDVFAAYLKSYGFVGVGQIRETAKPVRDVVINGKPLLTYQLQCQGLADNSQSDEYSEYVCVVDWIAAVDRSEAKWRRNEGLYTTTHIRASLDGQPRTIEFLDQEFGVDLRERVQ